MSAKKNIVKTALDQATLNEGLLYSGTGKETHLGGKTGTCSCHEQSTKTRQK